MSMCNVDGILTRCRSRQREKRDDYSVLGRERVEGQ